MITNEQFEEQLKLFDEMKEVESDAFFYTRLRACMDKLDKSSSWDYYLKPGWLMAVLMIMLVLNAWMVKDKLNSTRDAGMNSGIQSFASQYEFNQVVNY